MYQLRIRRAALKTLESLPQTVVVRISETIEELASEPRPHGCKKLNGAENLWRVRVGDYRVVYEIAEKIRVVEILKIGNRRDVYK